MQEWAYRILVSEVMLQQTQVARVIPKYEAWLVRFPTIQSLAKTRTSEVLALWSGLGYNRRALYLLRAAQQIIAKFGGKIPTDEKSLKKLLGIGQYTARAILCFAYNKQVTVVDTNIRKVILVHFFSKQLFNFSTRPWKKIKWSKRELQAVAEQILPKGRACEWNHALMDYAASVLSKQKVSIKKQTLFKGSNRYYRGKIIKLLLEKKRLSMTDLAALLNDRERLQTIYRRPHA